MGIFCDLEVDVNGEERFFLDMKILATFSSRLSKMFGRLVGNTSHLKLIFHDFPGGSEGFELVVRFCYNNGKIKITPSNIFPLHCAANFMQMKKDVPGIPNLIDQTEKYFERIQCWTWSNLLLCLKICQDVLAATASSTLLPKFLDLFARRLILLTAENSDISSSDNSISQLSSYTSSDSVKSYSSQSTWWFEDLVFLDIDLLEKVIKTMISQKFDHATICSFLFYYQRSKFHGASPDKKKKITGAVINLLFLLDRRSISCRGLLNLFGMALCLKINKSCKTKLECLIGSKLDHAKIDDLLLPSPRGKKYMYDVDLILRLLNSFLAENQFSLDQLKTVACLVDLYLAEVAPDPHLRPSKFVALAMVLPDFARDSQNRIYSAVDTYLKIHGSLCQEETMKVCSVLNYNKLSVDALMYRTNSSKFPQAHKLIVKNSKLLRTSE